MVHIFHFSPTSLVYEIVNPFSWIFIKCHLHGEKLPDFNGFPDLLTLHLGRVVRKPVNTNPGLKVNRGNKFSCIKVLSIAYVLCSLRLLMLKLIDKKYKQNSLLKSYKNDIKILPNPGLA